MQNSTYSNNVFILSINSFQAKAYKTEAERLQELLEDKEADKEQVWLYFSLRDLKPALRYGRT